MFQKHPSSLNNEEIMMIRNIMQRSNIDVSIEYIRETWHPLYRRHFLKQSLARAYDCRKGYYLYHQGLESEVRHVSYFDWWFYCNIQRQGLFIIQYVCCVDANERI